MNEENKKIYLEKLRSDWDNLIYIQMVIFFVIGFFIQTSADGRATLIFMSEEYGIVPMYKNVSVVLTGANNSMNYTYTNVVYNTSLEVTAKNKNKELLQKYSQDIVIQNKKIVLINYILYFILSPSLNYYYFIKWTRLKRQLKTNRTNDKIN